MTSLAYLGAISKSTEDGSLGLYDAVEIMKLAVPRKVALGGAAAAGTAGVGGLIAQDVSRQRKVNQSHPYPSTRAGQNKKAKDRSSNITSAVAGGAAGAYLGHTADTLYQAKQLHNTSRKFNAWETQRQAYDRAPNPGESFRDPKQASRVSGMRAKTTSHNPQEAKAAEDWLKGRGFGKEPPKKAPWADTPEGAAFKSHNEGFKRKYGVNMDAPATPDNVKRIKQGVSRTSLKRGAVIGGLSLGALSLRSARNKAREERMKPKRGSRR